MSIIPNPKELNKELEEEVLKKFSEEDAFLFPLAVSTNEGGMFLKLAQDAESLEDKVDLLIAALGHIERLASGSAYCSFGEVLYDMSEEFVKQRLLQKERMRKEH
jgi:hypothetical protein